MEALLVTQKVTEVISLKAQIERALAQLLTLAEQIKQVAIEIRKQVRIRAAYACEFCGVT